MSVVVPKEKDSPPCSMSFLLQIFWMKILMRTIFQSSWLDQETTFDKLYNALAGPSISL